MGFGKKKVSITNAKLEGIIIFSKDILIFLGITVDNKLTVEPYSESLYTLQRITNFPAAMQAPTLVLCKQPV